MYGNFECNVMQCKHFCCFKLPAWLNNVKTSSQLKTTRIEPWNENLQQKWNSSYVRTCILFTCCKYCTIVKFLNKEREIYIYTYVYTAGGRWCLQLHGYCKPTGFLAQYSMHFHLTIGTQYTYATYVHKSFLFLEIASAKPYIRTQGLPFLGDSFGKESKHFKSKVFHCFRGWAGTTLPCPRIVSYPVSKSQLENWGAKRLFIGCRAKIEICKTSISGFHCIHCTSNYIRESANNMRTVSVQTKYNTICHVLFKIWIKLHIEKSILEFRLHKGWYIKTICKQNIC